MLELLRSIPGPQFLLIFPMLTVAAIFAGRRMESGSDGSLPPEPAAFSPATIAALRGGWELVLKTVVFRMWNHGTIELFEDEEKVEVTRFLGMEIRSSSGKKASRMVFRQNEGAAPPTDRLEMAVWHFLKEPRSPEQFFSDDTLRSYTETFLRQARSELEQHRLIKSAEERRRSWLIFAGVCLAVMGTGTAKLAMGIAHHRPSLFLFLMLPIALIAISVSLRPASILTPLGRTYLKQVAEHFAWLQDAVKKDEPPGVDPAFAFAAYGTGAFSGSLLYGPFCDAFPARTSGGCGGGSCGGSSCSGGGCSGGGGCGGCGGGGD